MGSCHQGGTFINFVSGLAHHIKLYVSPDGKHDALISRNVQSNSDSIAEIAEIVKRLINDSIDSRNRSIIVSFFGWNRFIFRETICRMR